MKGPCLANPEGWANIPAELKARKQWCVAHINHADPSQRKIPRIVGTPGIKASPNDPMTWSTFHDAAMFAWKGGYAIGYVLSADDEFSCIDLDVKDKDNCPEKPELWTTPEQYKLYSEIVRQANSFTEISLSGKAVHIWVKGKIGEGLKYKGVEIYSQERFIICTGNVIKNVPIQNRQELLDSTVAEYRQLQAKHAQVTLEEVEPINTDAEVWEMATEAENGAKFIELAHGRFLQYNDKWTQSEADLALMSMFTFYSPSNEQCKRLFRMTTLGQWDILRNCRRDKSLDNDKYLNRTLTLVRSRQAAEKQIENAAIEKSRQVILNSLITERASRIPLPTDFSPPVAHINGNAPAVIPIPPQQQVSNLEVPATGAGELDWPPGFAAEIGKFIYLSAPRPIREVAIVATIGLLAGICGKAYHVPQSGLNCYVVLVARSAIGKEAMHSGIAAIMESLRSRSPSASNFVDFSSFASGQALQKACVSNPSFVHVCSEWGKKLRRMAKDNGNDSAMETLRDVMTALYQKSGPKSMVGGIRYSAKENDITSISGVAYSMIGETTPKTYYEALTDSMMEDGFLSRFTHIEYDGDRPELNEKPLDLPSSALADTIANLTIHALALNSQSKSTFVERDEEAAAYLKRFEKECDKQINGSRDEAWRQTWNRGALKALRIAALLAVCDNYVSPIIRLPHIQWAVELIRRDINLMNRKIKDGEVGSGDNARDRKIMSIIREYLMSAPPKSYGIPENLRKDFIIPRKYLQLRTASAGSFANHRGGSNSALNSTIQALCDDGYLKEVPKDALVKGYDFHGKCYRILDIQNG